MKQVLGAILMAIGLLIAGASGLCLAIMVPSMMMEGTASSADDLAMIAAIGGIPFAIGIAIIAGGWLLLRTRNDG